MLLLVLCTQPGHGAAQLPELQPGHPQDDCEPFDYFAMEMYGDSNDWKGIESAADSERRELQRRAHLHRRETQRHI
jgi:hypothetical protein